MAKKLLFGMLAAVLAFGMIIGCSDPAVSWDGDLVGTWTEDRTAAGGGGAGLTDKYGTDSISFYNGGRFEVKLDRNKVIFDEYLAQAKKDIENYRTIFNAWAGKPSWLTFSNYMAGATNIGPYTSVLGYRGTYTVVINSDLEEKELYNGAFKTRNSNGGKITTVPKEVLVHFYYDHDEDITGFSSFLDFIRSDIEFTSWVPYGNAAAIAGSVFNIIEAQVKAKYGADVWAEMIRQNDLDNPGSKYDTIVTAFKAVLEATVVSGYGYVPTPGATVDASSITLVSSVDLTSFLTATATLTMLQNAIAALDPDETDEATDIASIEAFITANYNNLYELSAGFSVAPIDNATYSILVAMYNDTVADKNNIGKLVLSVPSVELGRFKK